MPSRPDWLPEQFFKDGKADEKAFRGAFDELSAFKAAEEVKRTTIPAPDAYKVELPADFKAPQGIEFKFDDKDPLLAQARTIAHELGIPQDGFSKLLGLYAGSQVATAGQIETAKNAEIAKLGAAGPARVTNVMTWVKAVAGDELGSAIANNLWTAKQVEAFERIIGRFTNQGGSTFNTSHRDPGNTGLSDEEWSKLSYADKMDYARKNPQPQLNGSGR